MYTVATELMKHAAAAAADCTGLTPDMYTVATELMKRAAAAADKLPGTICPDPST